jgi:ribonuclease HI
MEVNIYINVHHAGHLSKGTGKYGVTIETYTDKGPATLQLYKGIHKTSRNRTALIACLDAFSHLKKPCFVNIFTDSTYIDSTINQEWYKSWDMEAWTNKRKPVANADLWKEFFKYYYIHKTSIFREEDTTYKSYVDTMLNIIEIKYKEDNTCLIHSENLTQ